MKSIALVLFLSLSSIITSEDLIDLDQVELDQQSRNAAIQRAQYFDNEIFRKKTEIMKNLKISFPEINDVDLTIELVVFDTTKINNFLSIRELSSTEKIPGDTITIKYLGKNSFLNYVNSNLLKSNTIFYIKRYTTSITYNVSYLIKNNREYRSSEVKAEFNKLSSCFSSGKPIIDSIFDLRIGYNIKIELFFIHEGKKIQAYSNSLIYDPLIKYA